MILRSPLLGRIAVIPVLLTDIPGQERTFRPALLCQQPMDCAVPRYPLGPFEAQRAEQVPADPRSCQKAPTSLDSLPLHQ